MEKKLTTRIPKMIEKIIAGVCKTYGASYKIDYDIGYPYLYNHKIVNDIFRKAAADLYGKKAVYDIPDPVMGGEDFAYFSKEVPAAMLRLGAMNKRIGADKPWHHPQFKVDETVIPIAAAHLAYSVVMGLG
jgi:metal-dependent amidase/aminoacylase/carboxypeptidase family protein